MQLNGAARWVWKLICPHDDGLKLFLSYFYDDYRHCHTTINNLFSLMTSPLFYSMSFSDPHRVILRFHFDTISNLYGSKGIMRVFYAENFIHGVFMAFAHSDIILEAILRL